MMRERGWDNHINRQSRRNKGNKQRPMDAKEMMKLKRKNAF